jgi:hypothetical protein
MGTTYETDRLRADFEKGLDEIHEKHREEYKKAQDEWWKNFYALENRLARQEGAATLLQSTLRRMQARTALADEIKKAEKKAEIEEALSKATFFETALLKQKEEIEAADFAKALAEDLVKEETEAAGFAKALVEKDLKQKENDDLKAALLKQQHRLQYMPALLDRANLLPRAPPVLLQKAKKNNRYSRRLLGEQPGEEEEPPESPLVEAEPPGSPLALTTTSTPEKSFL